MSLMAGECRAGIEVAGARRNNQAALTRSTPDYSVYAVTDFLRVSRSKALPTVARGLGDLGPVPVVKDPYPSAGTDLRAVDGTAGTV
jgi:hypothetical protein